VRPQAHADGNAGDSVLSSVASSRLQTGMTLTNLNFAKSYRFCVAAYDLDGNFSPCSESVEVGPG